MNYFTRSFVSFFRFCRRKRDLVFFRKKIKYRQFCILDDPKIAAISEKNVLSSLDRQSPTNHVPILAWLFKIIYVKLLFCLFDLFKVSWKTMKNGRKASLFGSMVLNQRLTFWHLKIRILRMQSSVLAHRPARSVLHPKRRGARRHDSKRYANLTDIKSAIYKSLFIFLRFMHQVIKHEI